VNGKSSEIVFRRSSFCGGGGCVEVSATSAGEIFVRDGKNLQEDAPVLRFDAEEWGAFLAGVNAGEFTHEKLARRS